jgi:hypothetical protein
MDLKNGEVLMSPNTIYWIQMPVNISEDDRIELLKRDILLINCNYGVDDLPKLKQKDSKFAAYFINLDGIFQKNHVNDDGLYDYCERIAKFLESFDPTKTVVHTYTIDEKICDIFRSKGLIYLEKNFGDKANAVNTVINLIKPIFSDENRVQRSFLRVNLYPDTKYKVEINLPLQTLNPVHCYLKDISLNGVGIIFQDKKDVSQFSLKDMIQVRIFTERSILNIPACLITRKDANGEIGVSYDINNRQMIKEDTANYLVKLIYNWIRDIIIKYGKADP